MSRYIEYEVNTGRIVSEINTSISPRSSGNIAYLEITTEQAVDLTGYIVKNGTLVKGYETNEERIERERIKREQGEKARLRIKSILQEYLFALLDENEEAAAELRTEFKKLKVYL